MKYTDLDGNQTLPNFSWDWLNLTDDPYNKLKNTMQAADAGNKSATRVLKYVFHEASRDILQRISEKSSYTSLVCLSIGQAEGASLFGIISAVSDGLLTFDDFIQGNYSEAKKEGVILIAGLTSSSFLKSEAKFLSKSIRITVGSTGRYYKVGKRGAIKSEKALREILAKDIADGYFGQEVVPSMPSIIDEAVKIYKKLTKDEK